MEWLECPHCDGDAVRSCAPDEWILGPDRCHACGIRGEVITDKHVGVLFEPDETTRCRQYACNACSEDDA